MLGERIPLASTTIKKREKKKKTRENRGPRKEVIDPSKSGQEGQRLVSKRAQE